ncbi:MAG: beta-ketoacyl reductase, partial [Gammaproteobacteria bacterium]
IFGLTEGWWRFADPDLRPAHPLLSAERWKSLLEESGFRHAGAVASPRETGDVWSTQALIVARAMETEPAAVMGAGPRGWLILAPEGSALAEGLRQQVKAAGDLATLAYPGRHYERTEAGDFRIDPASPADFRRLVDESAAEWRAPLARIVHLWATAPAPEAGLASANLETANVLGCGAALHLVQAALCAGEAASPELWLATRGAQLAASGQGLPGLAGSTLWGFGKVATLEFPELRCVRVDLDGDDDRAALSLYGEIRGGSAEDQVAFRGGRRYVARLVRHAGERRDFSVRPDGTYLITGGHRGLGLETAKWLVEQGARALVLLGRGDAKADAETGRELASLRRAGAVVEAVRADVADAGQVAGVIAHIDAHLPPLRGIVHSAGVLDDGILAQQSFERFQRVLAPKMLGAWNLHALTKSHTLDFFVLYSSLASLLGSAGQANHSAANAFLDALAHHRRALGLPGLSINWGVWSDIGAAVRHRVGQRVKAQGMGTISPGQGMRILGALLAQNGAQVGVAPIDWPVFAQLSKAGRKPPFFANFADRRPAAEASRPGGAVDLALELCAAPAAEREARVEAHLRVQVAGVLRLAPDEVSIEQPLNRIGLDSLMAVELRNRLRSQLGLDVPLVRFMEDLSIRSLASELGAQLVRAGSAGPERRESKPPAPPVSSEAEHLLARLVQLSDDEVDALLEAELAEHAAHVSDEGRP